MKLGNHPLVSVIIPAYNAAQYIVPAVESALQQTMTDLEIIVVDDGSTDATCELLTPYQERIRYLYQPNMGRSAARNAGIQRARGKYIAFLDADDTWFPDRLAHQVAFLEANQEISLVYSQAKIVDSDGRDQCVRDKPVTLGSGFSDTTYVFNELILGNFIPILTVTIKASVFNQVGLFDEDLSYPEDWDLWLRISRVDEIYFLPEILANYRVISDTQLATYASSESIINQFLYVIEKNSKDTDNLPPGTQERACAWVFARAAMAAISLGNLELARAYWVKSLSCDPYFFDIKGKDSIVQKAIYKAMSLEASKGYEGSKKYIENLVESFPVNKTDSKIIRDGINNEYGLSVIFYAYSKKDFKSVRQYIFPGLLRTPKWMTNRGVWKVGYHALLDKFKGS